MLFNLRGGGSGGVACAYVTYPAGTTLTCTNGSLTITDTNSSSTNRKGVCIRIPTVGTWTFSCTSGNYSDTKTIGVANGGSYQVDLNFREYMIRNGVVQTTVLFNTDRIYEDVRDKDGNPLPHKYPNTIVYVTNNWSGHCAMVMFPFDVTNFYRIVWDDGGPDEEREGAGVTSGVLTTSTWNQGFGTLTPVNYPPGSDYTMSNDRAMAMFDKWAYINNNMSGSKSYKYKYLDVSNLSGLRYITIQWTPFDGYQINVSIKDLYGER